MNKLLSISLFIILFYERNFFVRKNFKKKIKNEERKRR